MVFRFPSKRRFQIIWSNIYTLISELSFLSEIKNLAVKRYLIQTDDKQEEGDLGRTLFLQNTNAFSN